MQTIDKLQRLRPQIFRSLAVCYHSEKNIIHSSADINKICNIIKSHPYPKEPLDPTLNSLKPFSSRCCVEAVLKCLRKSRADAMKSLSFFNWAKKQNPQITNITTYEILLQNLLQSQSYDLAWQVFDEMQEQCQVSSDAIRTMLSSHVKNKSVDETMDAFERMQKYHPGGANTALLNIIVYYFCKHKTMQEAIEVFSKLQAKIPPDVSTFNILLSGFQKSEGLESSRKKFSKFVEMGFEPDVVSYNILIDGFCKGGKFNEALEMLKTMKGKHGCSPNCHTYVTLMSAVSDTKLCRQLFDEMRSKGVTPNLESYIVLVEILLKVRLLDEILVIINEMEEQGMPCTNLPYRRILVALLEDRNHGMIQHVFDIMVKHGCLLDLDTAGHLMSFFCELGQLDMAMKLWNHVIDQGCFFQYCDVKLLVDKLCASGRWQAAYDCCNQLVEKGKPPYKCLMTSLKKYSKERYYELYEKRRELKRSIDPTFYENVGK